LPEIIVGERISGRAFQKIIVTGKKRD